MDGFVRSEMALCRVSAQLTKLRDSARSGTAQSPVLAWPATVRVARAGGFAQGRGELSVCDPWSSDIREESIHLFRHFGRRDG